MQIIKYEDSTDLSEIYQSVGIQFALLSAPKNGYKQCHPLVKCRDFLQDAVRCVIPNNGISECKIYGFKYGNTINPLVDLNKMRMLVTYLDKDLNMTDSSIKMLYALKLIHHYEKVMDLKVKTRQKQIKHKDFKNPIWIFTGNKIWIESPVLISLYTFLIRLGDKKIEFTNHTGLENIYKQLVEDNIDDIGRIKDNDIRYLKTIGPKLGLFIKNYKEILFKGKFDRMFLDTTTSINSFHDNSGILSMAKYMVCNKETNDKYKELTT